MTNKEAKEPGEGQGSGRKPRGMGGVILILALLMALFLVVSNAGAPDDGKSVHAFYSHLLNARLSKVTITDGVASANVATPNGDRPIEIVLGSFLGGVAEEKAFISALQTQQLDTSLYTVSSSATREFLDDVQQDRVRVLRAFFVQEVEGKSTEPQRKKGQEPLRTAGNYVTALLQKASRVHYVRVDPSETGGPSLQAVSQALVAKGVPVREFSLSLAPSDFRVDQQNHALLYILGTVGPWLLVLAIVWFFILRQMRSPGGSGGVLSFGRSRASLYTKENRTNVTFDDVAGMEEAKAEVREIIEFLKNPGKFARLGGSIPRGVLLVGSPGTGKTLLAKAIAGEAEVPFFSISGSDFVEMFVGVGASRVRDLFKQAREATPVHRSSSTRSTRWVASAAPAWAAATTNASRRSTRSWSRWTASIPTRASSWSARPTAPTCSIRRCCDRVASIARSSSTAPTSRVARRSSRCTRAR